MKIPFFHHSKFLISVQFDRRFVPAGIDGKIDLCLSFLEALGKLARKSGHKLHATYSIVGGKNGYHAHFSVSWLPLRTAWRKKVLEETQPISRYLVSKLLEECYFYVDNKNKAIKQITHHRKFVTKYVLIQPRASQNVLFTSEYIHNDFIPTHSERKIKFYCSRTQFTYPQKSIKKSGCLPQIRLLLISLIMFIMISSILLSAH